MSTATSTDDYPDHDSVEVWHQLVGEYVQPMEPSPALEQHFCARMRIERMGSVEVMQVAATPYVVHRSPKAIEGDRGCGQVFCSLQLAGSHLILQDGQERIRHPGELVIFDPRYPCTLICDEPVRFLAFVFPRQAVGSDLEALVHGAATVLPTDQGIGALVKSFLSQLGGQMGNFQPSTAARLADHSIDLLSIFLADMAGTGSSIIDTDKRALMPQIKAYVEANLTDPDLSSTAVADAHYISIRHLQKIFQIHGFTVSDWIRERRLEHARRDLANPVQHGVPITVIADRWGFANSAHFSRVFKVAYGLSPRAYRYASLRSYRSVDPH